MSKIDSSIEGISPTNTSPIAVKSIVGDVFFSKNSNLLDTIRFYQVTRMVTDTVIVVRELHQLKCYRDSLNFSSPIIGRFIGEEIEANLRDKYIQDHDNTLLGLQLEYTDLCITHGVSIKIWDAIIH